MIENKVLLFNPRAANNKPRIPNSILSIAASIDGSFDYTIVDGNLESEPLNVLIRHLNTGNYKYFGCTCMPGPQLKQAIPFTKQIRELFPSVKIIWGGIFQAINISQYLIRDG